MMHFVFKDFLASFALFLVPCIFPSCKPAAEALQVGPPAVAVSARLRSMSTPQNTSIGYQGARKLSRGKGFSKGPRSIKRQPPPEGGISAKTQGWALGARDLVLGTGVRG